MPTFRDEGFVGDFWGSAGAGILFRARNTGRYLLLKRSWGVEDPGLWGIPGGAVPVDARGRRMDLWGAARREAHEETRRRVGVRAKRLGSYTWEAPGGTFRYTTFVVEVAREFAPVLNWESEGSWWFTVTEIRGGRRVHPGVAWVFDQIESGGGGRSARGRASTAKRLQWVRSKYSDSTAREVELTLLALLDPVHAGPPAAFAQLRPDTTISSASARAAWFREHPWSRYDRFVPWMAREIARWEREGRSAPAGARMSGHLPLIVDWIEGARVEGRRVDLGRFTFAEAWAAQEQWHRELAARGGRRLGPKDQGRVLWQSADRWTLQSLSSGQLRAEGEAMGHCVGGSGYQDHVARGQIEIWSLRDPRGQPHATVELAVSHPLAAARHGLDRPAARIVQVTQTQGKGDRLPIRRHRERLLDALLSGAPEAQASLGVPRWSRLGGPLKATPTALLRTLGPLEMFAWGRLPRDWNWWDVDEEPSWEFWHGGWKVVVSVVEGVVTVGAEWEIPDDLLNASTRGLYTLWRQYNSRRVAGYEYKDEFDEYIDGEKDTLYLYLFAEGDYLDHSPMVVVIDSIKADTTVGAAADAINELVDAVLSRADAAEASVRGKIAALERGELPEELSDLMQWEPRRW